MNCPRCSSITLEEQTRDDVIVDACPRCRGLWLDRGEIERLVARAAREAQDDHDALHPGGSRHFDDDDDGDHVPATRSAPPRRRWFERLADVFD